MTEELVDINGKVRGYVFNPTTEEQKEKNKAILEVLTNKWVYKDFPKPLSKRDKASGIAWMKTPDYVKDILWFSQERRTPRRPILYCNFRKRIWEKK